MTPIYIRGAGRLLASQCVMLTLVVSGVIARADASTEQQVSAETTTAKKMVVLDHSPTPETAKAINEVFQRSAVAAVFYTPESQMGRLGFNQEMARKLARFHLSVRCRSTCDTSLPRLRDALVKGLRIEGACPGSMGTVVDFSTERGEHVASITSTADGQCYTLGANSYVLRDLDFRNQLETVAKALQ